jgi:DNA-binding NarL/FixJ family response regulator
VRKARQGQLIRELRRRHPRTTVIGMTMLDPIQYEMQARAAGAEEFVVKEEGVAKMMQSIRVVLTDDDSVLGTAGYLADARGISGIARSFSRELPNIRPAFDRGAKVTYAWTEAGAPTDATAHAQ